MADAHSMGQSVDWRYLRRRSVNLFNLFGSVVATAFGLFWLVWILWTTLSYGVSAFGWALFTEGTPAPGSEGGLANAIVGSLLMVVLATLIGTPVGIMAGTYLAEFGRKGLIPGAIRFINDILLSAPSIIIGLFVYEIVVVRVGHFSGVAGALALAIIVLPVVIRTTEEMLRLVPNTLREAALALGAPRWKVITLVAYRAALSGILTGVLLAVARIAGETAPLLFTALNNQFWTTDLGQPMANLPVTIFQFAMSPYAQWHALAWAGSLLITLGVLALSIAARMLLTKARTEGL
jgi:phosphate transport system permease protein